MDIWLLSIQSIIKFTRFLPYLTGRGKGALDQYKSSINDQEELILAARNDKIASIDYRTQKAYEKTGVGIIDCLKSERHSNYTLAKKDSLPHD